MQSDDQSLLCNSLAGEVDIRGLDLDKICRIENGLVRPHSTSRRLAKDIIAVFAGALLFGK